MSGVARLFSLEVTSLANNEVPAWIELPLAEEMRKLPGKPLYDYGFVSGMGRLLAAHRRIGAAFVGLFTEIMFGEGTLNRAEREMVAAVAAAAQDCEY
jgi:alkylhydroperoxidase/carboxymuconolactone decarboxylase family protein YurZ